MHGIKILIGTTALLAGLALAPAARAQLVVQIGVQPTCSYGYYGYAPYSCAPYGYYGPGYFYNGIFLGMGPWGGWGYSHGWGSHRFVNEGGGRYHGGPGNVSYHSSGGQARGNAVVSHSNQARPAASHATGAPAGASRQAQVPRNTGSHAAPSGGGSHGGGGESHGGGGHEGGGEHH
jgi:hypothetical protein